MTLSRTNRHIRFIARARPHNPSWSAKADQPRFPAGAKTMDGPPSRTTAPATSRFRDIWDWPEHIMGCLIATLLAITPARADWKNFEIIEWQQRDKPRLEVLRHLGLTGVAVIPNREGSLTGLAPQTKAPKSLGLRWYIENAATDYYAAYHKFFPGKEVNWRFLEAQSRYRANPTDQAALYRDPSFLDPAWRAKIGTRMTAIVTEQKSARPLYYSLADETGIADLSAYWDFDMSPVSVAGFRRWLRGQYVSLRALNAEWSTSYASWDAIQPETTQTAMRRADRNFAAWNDFKAWMDTQFADAVRFGTRTIHHADPTALSGIEGAQVPGWGGYDYTKLAGAADLMEVYDDGENLPIIRSLAPKLVPLTTSFVGPPEEIHRIWREVLRGARGLILWDENDALVRPDATPGPLAATYAPLFAALRGEIGQRMQTAEPVYDDIAVLYSPISFRMQWMRDHQPLGDAWMNRSAEIEDEDNPWRASLRTYVAALNRQGLHPRFITPAQLASGPPRQSVLILPDTLALSTAESRAIAAFTARGGKVIADVQPGAFDEHGRARPAPPLSVPITQPDHLADVLKMHPLVLVQSDGPETDTYLFRSHGKYLLALQRHTALAPGGHVVVKTDGRSARNILTGKQVAADGVVELAPDQPVFLELKP